MHQTKTMPQPTNNFINKIYEVLNVVFFFIYETRNYQVFSISVVVRRVVSRKRDFKMVPLHTNDAAKTLTASGSHHQLNETGRENWRESDKLKHVKLFQYIWTFSNCSVFRYHRRRRCCCCCCVSHAYRKKHVSHWMLLSHSITN